MRTPKQAAAARLNGSKSRGPVTEAGKRRSSINSRRHGLLSKGVVLNNEVDETFQLLLQQHIEKFAPADDIEQNPIEEMTASIWRMRRLWMIEKHLLQRTMDGARTGTANAPEYRDEGDRIIAAFSELARGPELALLGRYESRLHRMYQRALNNFLLLRELQVGPQDPGASAPGPDPATEPEPGPVLVMPPAPQPPAAAQNSEITERTRRSTNPALSAACEVLLSAAPLPAPRAPIYGAVGFYPSASSSSLPRRQPDFCSKFLLK